MLSNLMKHRTTAFSLFFNDIPHFVRCDIFAFAKVILRLCRSDILFASSTAARQYHSAESRISLRSNRTCRKANRTEKSTCNSKCFFLAGVAESDKASLVACNNFMSLLLRKRWTIGSNPAKKLNKKQQMQKCICCFWLGWQDSNLRMQQSKCCVLPLDDTPILSLLSILIFQNIQIL